VRVFKNGWFQKFARKEKISDAMLCEAVARAERGQIDAESRGWPYQAARCSDPALGSLEDSGRWVLLSEHRRERSLRSGLPRVT